MKISSTIRLCIILFVLCFSISLSNDQWINYTNNEYICALVHDGDFLWIGTTGGLVRINKKTEEIEYFNKTNSGLPTNRITALALDKNNDLWIGTSGYGVLCYSQGEWIDFEDYPVPDGFYNDKPLNKYIRDIEFDKSDILWILTYKGLIKYDGDSWEVFYSDSTCKTNNYSHLAIDSTNNIWVATAVSFSNYSSIKLYKYNRNTWTEYNPENSGLQYAISCICAGNNSLWIGHGLRGMTEFNGSDFIKRGGYRIFSLAYYDSMLYGSTGRNIHKFKDNGWEKDPCSSVGGHIYVENSEEIWIGTGNGLFRSNFVNDEKIITSATTLPHNKISSIEISKNNDIYFGSNISNKIAKYSSKEWQSFKSAFDYPVFFIETDNDNNIFVGETYMTEGEIPTLSYICKNSKCFPDSIFAFCGPLTSMIIDRRNDLWASFDNESAPMYCVEHKLIKINNNQIESFDSTNSVFTNKYIYSIISDQYNNIWFGTDTGLIKYDEVNWDIYNTTNSKLPCDTIVYLNVDENNKLWIVTNNNQLITYEHNQAFKEEQINLGEYVINSIAFDSKGNTWLGVYGYGLIKYNDGNVEVYTSSNSGLSENTIHEVEVDKYDNVWIGTDCGVCVFNENGIVSNTEKKEIPKSSIHSSPNPFSESTTISYYLEHPSQVNLTVFDLLGNEAAVLVDGWKEAGRHEARFDGSGIPPGMYFYVLRSGERVESGKIIHLK
jgi:ligand-binding sensor domain-containing protein